MNDSGVDEAAPIRIDEHAGERRAFAVTEVDEFPADPAGTRRPNAQPASGPPPPSGRPSRFRQRSVRLPLLAVPSRATRASPAHSPAVR